MHALKAARAVYTRRLVSRLPTKFQHPVRFVSSTKQSEVQHNTAIRTPPESDTAALLWARSNQLGGSRGLGAVTDDGSWSSPHDKVARNAFTNDHARLWTLLETAIAEGEMKRAQDYVIGLASIASVSDTTLAVNSYLLKLVEMNPKNPEVAREWLAEMKDSIAVFQPNSVTDVALLKNLVTADQTDQVQTFVDEYVMGRGSLRQLLSHVDILGLSGLQTVVEKCSIPLSMVNERYREILQKAAGGEKSDSVELDVPKSKLSYPMDKETHIPTLQKGTVEDVIATDTLGLKAIRHTLTGLKSSEQIQQALAPHLMDKKIDENNYIDFLKIYEDLKEDEIVEFNRALDTLNLERQQEIEARGFEGAREKWRVNFERQRAAAGGLGEAPKGRKLDTMLWEWNEAMMPLVKAEFVRIKEVLKYNTPKEVPSHVKADTGPAQSVSTSDRFEYGPYLQSVNPENLPAITMIELLNLHSTGGVHEGMRSSRAVIEVGRTVEQEFRRHWTAKREREALKGFKIKQQHAQDQTVSDTIQELKSQVSQSDMNTKFASWPTAVRAKIGSLLIAMLLEVARVPVVGTDPIDGSKVHGTAPAFYHTYQYQNGSKLGVLKLHRDLAKHLDGEVLSAAVQPQMLPMLVKPRPWTAYNKGGYRYTNSRIMRSRDSPEQVAYLKTASDLGQLDEVYKGLNVLGDTAWTVNKDIFKVLLKVWNTGETFLDIPKKVGVRVEALPPQPPRNCDPSVRRDWLRECRRLVNENQQLFSQRCDANYKLEIARAFLGERFYFPHNLDFRGRAYPLPPHLNHLGNDMSRGLLKFWDGKKLGESGLRWLKIHVANVFGHSKFSFDDRCKFVEDNLEQVLESANNPLEGKGWWKQAESPWQCLAACMELRDALKLPDPTQFVSRIPVHQDGTCNGLQHYAALGGDMEGAQEVNLVPSEKPQDVYSRVLRIVEGLVDKEAEQGVEVAKMLQGRLSRKVVKQTVMTNVYGVTFIGARQQIANKLRDFKELDRMDVFKMSTYLAAKVLEAVRTLFYGAHLIQDWLGDNATLIARSVRLDTAEVTSSRRTKKRPNYMSSVIWTTPLGLPCVQPYREESKKQIGTAIQSVYIADPYAVRTVNARKQKTAFPPNYIHSLDATHMLMSAVGCGEGGVTFAAVHDSYWTHAGSIDKMNMILRDSFINLHSEDLVKQLRDEFQERYSGLLHLVQIRKDSRVAQEILNLRTKWAEKLGLGSGTSAGAKLSIQDQVCIEKERLKLLESADPYERAQGETMVTPVTLVEALDHSELERLVAEATELLDAKKRKIKGKSAPVRKSSEFEGNGLDMYQMDAAKCESEQTAPADEDAEFERPNKSVMASSASAADAPDLKRSGSGSDTLVSVLVPLRIPEVPEKGEFDVNMLKNSEYFFS